MLEGLTAKFAESGVAAKAELGTLRKSRDVVEKFSAGSPRGGGFVDRQA